MGALSSIIATDPRAARQAASTLKTKGKGGDTELAHVNPRELIALRQISGRAPDGSQDNINPATGLPMFDDSDDDGNTGNTSNAGENTGGSNPGGSDPNTGGSTAGGGNGVGGASGGITDMGDVGYASGMGPTAYSSPASINETEASTASRAGTSTADDYAGMGPDKANQYGVGWNEYSEQTTGLTGALNSLMGVDVKGPNVNTPNASYSVQADPIGMVGSFFGPIGALAAAGVKALGAPESVTVAGGQYKSEIGHNIAPTSTEMAAATAGMPSGNSSVSGPDTNNSGGNDGAMVSAGTSGASEPTQAGGQEGPAVTPLSSTERNTNRSLDAGKYIDSLRARWGFPAMNGGNRSILNQIVGGAGRFGDSEVAHLSPEAQQMLKGAGGAGSRNPITGMPEFYDAANTTKGFMSVLGRAPTEADLTHHASLGSNNYNELVGWLQQSDEAKGLGGRKATAVQDAFKTSFGRDAGQTDIDHYLAQMAQWQKGGQDPFATLTSKLKGTNEAQNYAIRGMYKDVLGRDAENNAAVLGWNKQMDDWLAAGQDPYANLRAGFEGSAEYKQKTAPPPVAPKPITTIPTTVLPTPTLAPPKPVAAALPAPVAQPPVKPATMPPATPAPNAAAPPPVAPKPAISPLQRVSGLTPVRMPRFRSTRYQGFTPTTFG